MCARGLCRPCYNAAYHDDNHFDGLKQRILNRDEYRCRVCATKTNVVHHATVERLQRPDCYLPPLLSVLWREIHPGLGEQLAFELESLFERKSNDLKTMAAGAP